MAWHPFRHFGLKIGALALATLLWFTVSGQQIDRRVPLAVSYSNVPDGLELTGDQLDVASVHVRGGDRVVSALRQGELSMIINLADAHAGTNLMTMQTDEVRAPLGLEVLQVDPPAVTVTLERSGSQRVPVTPTVEGKPATGFVAGEPHVDPSTVLVYGPESLLKGSILVITGRVLIDGRTSTVVQDVSVGVADSQLRMREPRTVRVTVPIESERRIP